jgi:hypothetical protein
VKVTFKEKDDRIGQLNRQLRMMENSLKSAKKQLHQKQQADLDKLIRQPKQLMTEQAVKKNHPAPLVDIKTEVVDEVQTVAVGEVKKETANLIPAQTKIQKAAGSNDQLPKDASAAKIQSEVVQEMTPAPSTISDEARLLVETSAPMTVSMETGHVVETVALTPVSMETCKAKEEAGSLAEAAVLPPVSMETCQVEAKDKEEARPLIETVALTPVSMETHQAEVKDQKEGRPLTETMALMPVSMEAEVAKEKVEGRAHAESVVQVGMPRSPGKAAASLTRVVEKEEATPVDLTEVPDMGTDRQATRQVPLILDGLVAESTPEQSEETKKVEPLTHSASDNQHMNPAISETEHIAFTEKIIQDMNQNHSSGPLPETEQAPESFSLVKVDQIMS